MCRSRNLKYYTHLASSSLDVTNLVQGGSGRLLLPAADVVLLFRKPVGDVSDVSQSRNGDDGLVSFTGDVADNRLSALANT